MFTQCAFILNLQQYKLLNIYISKPMANEVWTIVGRQHDLDV